MADNTPKTLRNQMMYQVFVRNYSEAGTFAQVEHDLDRARMRRRKSIPDLTARKEKSPKLTSSGQKRR